MPDLVEPSAGFFGKHPAFGDFVGHGLSGAVQMAMQDWLTGMLAQARAILGDDWQGVYDTSRPIRFWIGSDVFKTQILRGVICPSHDKVGRRYPFVLVQENAPVMPPALDSDQGFHAGAEAFARVALERTPEMSKDIMATSSHDRKEEAPLDPPMFWATNPGTDVAELLGVTAATDHARAAANRSYWWVAGTGLRASTVLACEGPLQADGLAWLLRGTTVEDEISDPIKEGADSD